MEGIEDKISSKACKARMTKGKIAGESRVYRSSRRGRATALQGERHHKLSQRATARCCAQLMVRQIGAAQPMPGSDGQCLRTFSRWGQRNKR